jgi:hypothetical protein
LHVFATAKNRCLVFYLSNDATSICVTAPFEANAADILVVLLDHPTDSRAIGASGSRIVEAAYPCALEGTAGYTKGRPKIEDY